MSNIGAYRLLFLVLILGLMMEREAQAYTDPGSAILAVAGDRLGIRCWFVLRTTYYRLDPETNQLNDLTSTPCKSQRNRHYNRESELRFATLRVN